MDSTIVKTTPQQALGLRGRLFIGFALIAAVLMLATGLVLFKLTEAKKFAEQVLAHDFQANGAAYSLDIAIISSLTATQSWLLTHDTRFKEESQETWRNISKLLPLLEDYSRLPNNQAFAQGWQQVQPLITRFKTSQEKTQDTRDERQAKLLFLSETYPLANQILDILDGPLNAQGERVGGIFDMQDEKYKQSTQEIITNINDIRLIEYLLLATSLAFCVAVALYTKQALLKYVNTFRRQSSRIATGDLTQRIAVTSQDELGLLGQDLNSMTESLASITRQITEGCQHIVTTLEEVKHAVDSQSSGASEQASSINQITASLSEIEKSSSQTIEKTKTLGATAQRTQEKGELGLEAVEQSIIGMKAVREKVQMIAQTILDLSNKTQQIGEITAAVNMLSQQSKMLALNASIEAAKAGEAGKGFAVVAEEVKNLAEQSEQSTTQVQKIIEDIRHATEKAVMATEEGTKGVDEGTGLVEQTGEVVRSLSEVIHEAMLATQQIEAAVRQESAGIEQITAGMTEINQVTASFVESVKQTTEAVSHLSGIAKHLKENAEVYKV